MAPLKPPARTRALARSRSFHRYQAVAPLKLDVAVRLSTLGTSSYVMRRLGSEPEIIVATPARAEEYAIGDDPARLRGVPWIVHSALGVRATRTLRPAQGR